MFLDDSTGKPGTSEPSVTLARFDSGVFHTQFTGERRQKGGSGWVLFPVLDLTRAALM